MTRSVKSQVLMMVVSIAIFIGGFFGLRLYDPKLDATEFMIAYAIGGFGFFMSLIIDEFGRR